MKIDLKILQQLASTYGVIPVANFPVLKNIVDNTSKSTSEYEPILTGAGYEWDAEHNRYKLDDQSVYFFPPKNLFIWIWNGELVRLLQGSESLTKWVQGSEKYQEGKANAFITLYKQLSGENTPLPDKKEPPKPLDPVDAVIIDAKSKMNKYGKLAQDDIIDIYNKAKELKSNKLMNFVKSLKPITENTLKYSQLDTLIRGIVKGILKEAYGSDYGSQYGSFSKPNKLENWITSVANKLWKDPEDIGMGYNPWRLTKTRNVETGETVYQLKKEKRISLSRFIINRNGQYYYLDPKTKK